MPRPQFLLVELPTFRIKDLSGHTVIPSAKQLGHILSRYTYVRSGLSSAPYSDMSASFLFSGGEPDLWTASNNYPCGTLHAEENLLLIYHQSFDSPGAYPIVDAVLLSGKPCSGCLGYFAQTTSAGKVCAPAAETGVEPFRGKFTPRSDRSFTPAFYLARSLDEAARSTLWMQIGSVFAADFGGVVAREDVGKGQAYHLMEGSPWFAVNGQEGMRDEEVAEKIRAMGLCGTYWIGR